MPGRFATLRGMAQAAPGLSRREQVAYAAGYLGVSLLTFAVSQWLQSYYVPTTGGDPLLASAALFGTALVVGRIIDGLADPIAGYFSDTFRSRIGRRRPFLLLFGPLAGLTFVMLYPRVAPGEVIPYSYFLGTLCAYYFTYTLAVTPYLALLPELAATDRGRLGITTMQTFFNFGGIAIAMVLGAEIRTNPLMAPILGAVGGLALMLPGLLVQERAVPTPEGPRPSLGGMFGELWAALQNRLFLLYVASQLCMWFGFNMILAWMPYLVERLLRGPSVTMANLSVLGTALLLLPVAYRFVLRIGKVRGLMVAMAAFALVFVALSQLGRLPAPPVDLERMAHRRSHHTGALVTPEQVRANLDPSEVEGDPGQRNWRWVAGIALLLSLGLPLAVFFLTPNTIMSHVIDLDRQERGGGREGMFFAAQAVVIQTGGAWSGWVLNRVLTEGGDQATLAGIAAVGPVAGAVIGLGVVILWRFAGKLPPVQDGTR